MNVMSRRRRRERVDTNIDTTIPLVRISFLGIVLQSALTSWAVDGATWPSWQSSAPSCQHLQLQGLPKTARWCSSCCCYGIVSTVDDAQMMQHCYNYYFLVG